MAPLLRIGLGQGLDSFLLMSLFNLNFGPLEVEDSLYSSGHGNIRSITKVAIYVRIHSFILGANI